MKRKTSDGIKLALEKLDWFEMHPEFAKHFNWDAIVEVSGKSRTTLWRNQKVKERFNCISKEFKKNSYKPLSEKQLKRKSHEQRITSLEVEIIKLKEDKENLIETLLAIYQHFGDQMDSSGLDVNMLKEICDNKSNSNGKVIPFDAPSILIE